MNSQAPRRGAGHEPEGEQKTREKRARLLSVNRLRESPDFWVMKDLLLASIAMHERLLKRRVVTPADQAEHHFNLGILAGLDFALRGTEIIEQSEQPPLAKEI